ncbi:hypothetical protein OAO01_05725 [Oligoflexia bacterium]|nr:hypothetical protein [Oligoflexia bacterium]
MNEDQVNEPKSPFPDISDIIDKSQFADARAAIEEKLTSEALSEKEREWLTFQRLMCIVGCSAKALLAGKDAFQVSQHKDAQKAFTEALSIIEPHLVECGLDEALATQMRNEMQKMVNDSRFENLSQLYKDRDDIIAALQAMPFGIMEQRALALLLDAQFNLTLSEKYIDADQAGDDLSWLTELLENGEFEKALKKVEMERLRHPGNPIFQEHLDQVERAARSILVIKKYRAAEELFTKHSPEQGLVLYEEITALMQGRYMLFQLNEEGLNGVIADFESKLTDGTIASYEDTLAYRTSYTEPLKEKYGSSPDWQTITMVLDAHIGLTFYKKIKAGLKRKEKKKKGLFGIKLWH